MSNRFLITVATAALIAGTSFASAQAPGGGAGSAGGGAQQSAPPSGGATGGGAMQRDSSPGAGGSGMRGGESSGMKGSDTGMKASETNEKAQPGSKSAQDGNRMQGEKSKSMHSETDSKGGKDMKAEGRDSKSGEMNNAQTKGADGKAQTTGNAATSAKAAAPPPEKRAQINTAFRSEKIQETTNVNFNISVGTAIPASVHFHPIPPRIVEIYPEWRGYDVILVSGRYIIVRPQTREIVYIIEG
jgi:hypothetical protein